MSYHGLGQAKPQSAEVMARGFTPTVAFAQSVDPHSWRVSPPGAIFSPYGWGPEMTVGMPAYYAHHAGYVREPGTQLGPMYDRLSTFGNYEQSASRGGGELGTYMVWPGGALNGLDGVFAVL